MKVLDADSWLKENKEKYPNGCNINRVMDSYAEYFHEETSKYECLMGKWKSEWYSKYKYPAPNPGSLNSFLSSAVIDFHLNSFP